MLRIACGHGGGMEEACCVLGGTLNDFGGVAIGNQQTQFCMDAHGGHPRAVNMAALMTNRKNCQGW